MPEPGHSHNLESTLTGQATSRSFKTSKHRQRKETFMKTLSAITTVVGAATLLMAGHVFLAALPDLRRYIKISTM
jgi:hypothetical protein